MNSKGSIALVIVFSVLAVAVVGFAGWSWYQANQEQEENSAQSQGESESEESVSSEEWVEYRNDDLGFAFEYPEEWGEVEVDQESLERYPRTTFIASFSGSEVAFGVIANNYWEGPPGGRGGSLLDYQGFVKRDDQFYIVDYDGDAQRQVTDNTYSEDYTEIDTHDGTALYNPSFDYWGEQTAHWVVNIDSANFSAINMYVNVSEEDAEELVDIAGTFRLLE